MQEIPSLPPSPCPDLVESNSPPTDAQASVIHQAIQTTEDRISSLDSHIVELKKTIEQCQLRRQELVAFVHLHRGVVSSLRRVPSEILGEIFKHVIQENIYTDTEALCGLGAVCGHWRTVTLSNPFLWRNIDLNDLRAQKNTSLQSRRITTQIQRSREAPLVVTVITAHNFDPRTLPLFDLLLMASARWQRATLSLWPGQFAHISQSGAAFSSLSTLKLYVDNSFPQNASRFFKSLCAMTDLTLETAVPIPSNLGLPWAQLRACSLSHFSLKDIVHVLPLLPPQSSLSLRSSGHWRGPLPSLTTSFISALSFDDCKLDFVDQLLAILTSPTLKKLAIRPGHAGTRDKLRPFLRYLLRSQCALTDLALFLDDQSSIDTLVELLESGPVRGIVDLECYISYYDILHPSIFSLLAKQPLLLPELRVLALRTSPGSRRLDDEVLEFCGARRRSLQELWIEQPYRMGSLDQVTLSQLRAGGLEVVVTPLFRDLW
ncbi:hypothetical protein C8F01DRAFT_667194 [Mycena amicta]|nr:hypothetical protein C8F01DRAFT_667194 [Mycena amicta]